MCEGYDKVGANVIDPWNALTGEQGEHVASCLSGIRHCEAMSTPVTGDRSGILLTRNTKKYHLAMVENHLPVLSFEARQFSLAIGARGVEEDDNSSTARNGLTVDSDTGVVDDGEVGTGIADAERPVVVAVSSTRA